MVVLLGSRAGGGASQKIREKHKANTTSSLSLLTPPSIRSWRMMTAASSGNHAVLLTGCGMIHGFASGNLTSWDEERDRTYRSICMVRKGRGGNTLLESEMRGSN